MTDDTLPSTDAARAREGMVDELKTINKYEEMASESKNDAVADTLKEVADDEKVHVGNFAALVAKEDPEAVPKMEEGLRETEKDTGIKVSREFKRARPMKGRRKFWDHKIYNLNGWEKSPHDGYWYNKLDPNAVEPPMWKYGANRDKAMRTLAVNDMLTRQAIREKKAAAKDTRTPRERDRDHWYLTLTQSNKFDGTLEDFDKIFDEFKENVLTRPDISMKLLEEGPRTYPKLESFDETLKAEKEAEEKAKEEAKKKAEQEAYRLKGEATKWATIDGTEPPKKKGDDDEGKTEGQPKGPEKDEALERYEAEFKESEGDFAKAVTIGDLIDKAILKPNDLEDKVDEQTGFLYEIQDQIEQLEKEKAAMKPRMTMAQQQDFVNRLLMEKRGGNPEIRKEIMTLNPADAEDIERDYSMRAKGSEKVDPNLISWFSRLLEESRQKSRARDSAILDKKRSESKIMSKIANLNAQIEGNTGQEGMAEEEEKPLSAETIRHNTLTDQLSKKEDQYRAAISRMKEFLSGKSPEWLQRNVESVTVPGSKKKLFLKNEKDLAYAMTALANNPNSLNWIWKNTKDAEILSKIVDTTKSIANERDSLTKALNDLNMEMRKVDNYAERESPINRELRARQVDQNTGEYDWENWFDTDLVGNTFYTPSGIAINPYDYGYDEDQISPIIETMSKKPGRDKEGNWAESKPYGKTMKKWLQGIRDALYAKGFDELDSKTYRNIPSFPKDTFLTKNKGIDLIGALGRMGINTVGDLRKFMSNDNEHGWVSIYNAGKKALDKKIIQSNKPDEEKRANIAKVHEMYGDDTREPLTDDEIALIFEDSNAVDTEGISEKLTDKEKEVIKKNFLTAKEKKYLEKGENGKDKAHFAIADLTRDLISHNPLSDDKTYSDEDTQYILENFGGFGSPESKNYTDLAYAIKGLPEGMMLREHNLMHPKVMAGVAEDGDRDEYEQWIRDNYTTSSNMAVKRVDEVLAVLAAALKAVRDPNISPEEKNEAISSAEAAILNYSRGLNPKNVPDNGIFSDPAGVQLIDYIRRSAALGPKETNIDAMIKAGAAPEEIEEAKRNNELAAAERPVRDLMRRFADTAEQILLREIAGKGVDAQRYIAQEKARPILGEYLEKLDRINNIYNKEDLPPIVAKTLNDINKRLKYIDDSYKLWTKGTKEYEDYEKQNHGHMGKAPLNVDFIFGDKFQKYAIPLIDEINKYLYDVGGKKLAFDRYGYYMADTNQQDFDILGEKIKASDKWKERAVKMLKNTGDADLIAKYKGTKRPMADLIRDLMPYYPREITGWLSKYAKYTGTNRPMGDVAAELYQMRGDDKDASISDNKVDWREPISTWDGGSNLEGVELAKEFDTMRGRPEKEPGGGYYTKEFRNYSDGSDSTSEDSLEDDAEEVDAKNDEYVSRRTQAVLETLRDIDNPLYGVMVQPSGNGMDEAAIITPAQLGYDEEELANKPIDDETIKAIVDEMHRRGAITKMDVKDESDAYYKVGDLIAATRGEGRDLRDHIPSSEDLKEYPTDVLQETEDQINSDKGLGFTVSPEEEESAEKRRRYKDEVTNLNQAELLSMEADALENKPIEGLKGQYADVDIKDSTKARTARMDQLRKDMANRDKRVDNARRVLKDRVRTNNHGLGFGSREMKEQVRDAAEGNNPTEKVGIQDFDKLVDAVNIPRFTYDTIKELLAEKMSEDVRTSPPTITQEAIDSANAHNEKLRQERADVIAGKRASSKALRDAALSSGVKFETDTPESSPEFQSQVESLGLENIPTDDLAKMQITRSASGQKSERPPLRVERVFSQAIPFYGIKLDLNANEPFDAAKYKMVKKEVQGSKRTNVDRMIRDRQKH